MQEQFFVSSDQPILKNHKAYGQELLPGLAYIDMIYQIFQEYHYSYTELELRNLTIYNPLIVGHNSKVMVSIQCSEIKDGQWQIRVEGQEQHDGTLALDKKLYVAAEMYRRNPIVFEELLDLNQIKQSAKTIISLDEVYKQCRHRELVHTGIMKAEGRIYDVGTAAIIESSICQDALPGATDFMFHPTLIDGSSIGSGGLLSSLIKEEQRLFLPLFFESFRASALLQKQCVTRIQTASVQRKKELLYLTMEFFNESGKKVAELKNFANKLVRGAGLINPNINKTTQPTTGPQLIKPFLPHHPQASIEEQNTANTTSSIEVEAFLQQLIAERLKKPVEQIEAQVGYYEMGLDSPGLLEVVKAIETKIETTLPPTLLFEYTTIAELSAYLTENYALQFGGSGAEKQDVKQERSYSIAVESPVGAQASIPEFVIGNHISPKVIPGASSAATMSANAEGIAIIGMAGRFPGARNIQEFWSNLKKGKDCITEIPKSRWDWQRHEGIKSPSGKNMSRWGGFIEDPDCFDPQFFRISPWEAEIMDPQERLFLETCWESIEDAGYTPKTLVVPQGLNKRRRVGVFVGVMHKDYILIGAEVVSQGQVFPLSLNYAPIANRVSYFCNFHGPSMAVDTVCSSSLTALHLALDSIRNGECEVAMAGGVNLSLHSDKYMTYGMAGLHSSDGYCHTFGKGGDGYVSGDGIGVVLLKPLSKAIQDKDHIYAVIKGSTINHVGTVSGISVPSPVAQADLIRECLEKTGVSPRTISYVEAHGTGTSLGDPIEIQGLVKAYREYTQDQQFCSIGSVKSNIGHAESAAGISGLIKVALQLYYKTLVPSLHSEELNPYIDFKQSPFYVQHQTEEWKQPVIVENGQEVNYPRRAGLSSFGATGSNAHIILEEYLFREIEQPTPATFITEANLVIVPLSAKNKERLQDYAKKLLEFLKGINHDQEAVATHDRVFGHAEIILYNKEINLSELAYTLQVGREAMKDRVAFIVKDIPELTEKLGFFIEGKDVIDNCWRGQVKHDKESIDFLSTDQDSLELIHRWMAKGNIKKISELWVKGLNIDWNQLYGENKPGRISLPTYPFARERYWVPKVESRSGGSSTTNPTVTDCIHPLLHRNTSDFSEQRFSSTFTGREFFLADHVVRGQRVLPGVAYLEMARAAVDQAAGALKESQTGIRLKNVVCAQPIAVGEQPVEVHIGLFPEDSGEIAYEIYSEPETGSTDPVVHCRGIALLSPVAEVPILDLRALQAQCTQSTLSAAQCYEAFRIIGLDYGPGHQGIEEVYVGAGKVLAKLSLPSSVSDTRDQFVLHPGLMDSALQASIGLMMGSGELKPSLPFTLQELEAIGNCSSAMWAFIRYSDSSKAEDKVQKLDIDLCDEQGNVCVRLKAMETQENAETMLDAALQTSPQSTAVPKTQEAFEMMTFEEVWHEQALADSSPVEIKTLVCFLSDPENQQAIAEAIQALNQQTEVIFISQSTTYTKQSQQKYSISRTDLSTYEEAFKNIREDCGEVNSVLYLWALEDPRCIRDYSSIVYILQAIASAKLKTRQFLLAAQFENALDRCYMESWIGFERSLGLIFPNTQMATIYQEAYDQNRETVMKDWLQKLLTELRARKAQSVLYQNGKRHVYQVRPTTIQSGNIQLRPGGTYLITGGCGGLGHLFAQHFAQKHPVNLILTGRSPIDEEKQFKIKALEDLGSQVLYVQADVADPTRMKEGLSQARGCFGEIHGVIHAAGIEGTQSIFEKDIQSFQKVLEPKIKGTLVLDDLLSEDALDFICYFSSSAAILGDFGTCDYAVANRFQMAYAHYRNQQQSQGQKQGKTVVINWPLWKDGGMGFGDDENTKMYLKSSGQHFLEAKEGVAMFDRILAQNNTQYLVMVGQPSRVQRFLGLIQDKAATSDSIISSSSGKGRRAEMKEMSLAQCLEWDMKEHISKLLKISRDKLDVEQNLADLGFDSISLTRFAALLTDHYGIEISPALFFGHSTLAKLDQYFLTEHQEAIQEFYREDVVEQAISPRTQVAAVTPKRQEHRKPRFTMGSLHQTVPEPIAIIGMSGRFPKADTAEELWKNLKDGNECITDIPADRWDWREYCEDYSKESGKTNCKWGGYIAGMDRFDPLFFEISPKEAELIDPQQRLFLEEAWHALEDAGYMGERIKGKSCGVYVGVEEGEYGFLVGENGLINSNQNATLPARIAYKLDLKGPNLALTAACSSGLVAIHQACQALRQGDCEMALVGGVSLLISHMSYLGLSESEMLSPDGKCYVFDQRANGLVPGEAVAVVLLKPLSKAILDKDQIYGCIKASGVNYNGKTNGITAPNPLSQAELVRSIYDKHHIDPGNIQYVMAHSVGLQLGDSIEIQALSNAFNNYTDKKQYCTIGSIKPLIGHTFAASGVVSLISMLMAMKYNIIPATCNYEASSEIIDFKKSPFIVHKENQLWSTKNNQPKLGTISTTGISGTNAHIVIEEYHPQTDAARAPVSIRTNNPILFVLSAKSEERLKAYAQSMKNFIESYQNLNLADMAYTLQVGREAMDHRLAFLVNSREDLLKTLEGFLNNNLPAGVLTAQVTKSKDGVAVFEADEDAKALLQTWIQKGKLKKLSELWIKGLNIDWNQLYGENKARLISLPTYPFARERYWAPEIGTKSATGTTALIHPLLHQNTSDFSEQRFSSTFTGREFFLADHVVKGQRFLPGVAHLEMVRAAVEQATAAVEGSRTVIRLKNVAWARPTVVGDQPVRVHIELYPEDNGDIAYEIYSVSEEAGVEPVVYSQGSAVLSSAPEVLTLDLEVLQAQCTKSTLSSTQCYAAFRTVGLDYGPGHQGIETVYVGEGQILAKLSLPSSVSNTKDQFVLHPGLMDSALQASIGFMIGAGETMPSGSITPMRPSLPFALQEIEILGKCTSTMWTFIRFSAGSTAGDKVQKLDIDVCDENGTISVRLKGLSSRVLGGEAGSAGAAATLGYALNNEIAQSDDGLYQNLPALSLRNEDIEENKPVPAMAPDLFQEKAENYFKKMLSSVIKLPAHRIEADAPMEKYGINSIMVMQLTNQLEKTFGSLSKTLFFEYQNIQELTKYFLESYGDQLTKLLGIEDEAAATGNFEVSVPQSEPVKPTLRSRKGSRFASLGTESREEKTTGALDIAIIGVSGRYPQARNINEFWKNLRDGKDCVTEIPKDRWDHSLYFDEDKDKPGKIYSKWGGFIEGVDQFDPLFFNISPREAEIMDPQERLFLQCVYETLEDAGYTREALGRHQSFGLAGNVGVYVGVMYEEYQLYGVREQLKGRPIALAGNPASIANRISYFYNFHGPSMAVETMCSSSLTAIHLACQSLQRGGCDVAITGGVNVSIHPNKYLALSQGKFVSSKGRCESFGQGGDGYVPGEGVGAVLLKPLSKAMADGDNIYGVIKATAINHGGKTNGYSVPNPNAQASVIGQALKEAGIHPRTISYIEAHGTGTSLGDPIEIAGLTKTYQEYTKDKLFCAIGSAKSNIGHCESAAGIAGVTKVLLQLKYGQLVPSLHSEELNPNIDFSNTPFVVQQELAEWKRPLVEIKGEKREYPRIAGISSFGAGGSNAHVVIEEYIPQDLVQPQITITPKIPAIIVLSAKNEVQLKEQGQQLLAAIQDQQISLADMAYTLQVGREAMEERLAVIVGSVKELEEKLKEFAEGQDSIDNLYRGQVMGNKKDLAVFAADEDMAKSIDAWIAKGKYMKFANLWVKGLAFDWNKLYGDSKPRRISLPTYPFDRKRYWVPETDTNSGGITTSPAIAAFIHPLVHQNTSDLSEQRFTSTFTGQEFFLADHVVKGQKVLPGVAHLEMARAAVEQAAGVLKEGKTGIRLKNVVWVRPFAMGDQPVRLHTGLFPEDNGEIAYEIYSGSEAAGANLVVYSQGSAVLSPVPEILTLDVEALQAQCTQGTLSSAQCYEAFRALGLEYGPGHQGIEKVYVGAGQVLAKLSLSFYVSDTKDQFVLHPGLMDSALQASIGLMMGAGETMSSGKPALPFALQELEILGKCTSNMWAFIRFSHGSTPGDKVQKIDIDVCDESGTISVRLKGLSSRVLGGEAGSAGAEANRGKLMIQSSWKEQAITQKATAPDYAQHLVILCEMGDVSSESIETQMKGVRCLTLESKQDGIEERFRNCAVVTFGEIQSIFKDKVRGNVMIQVVVSTREEQQLFTGLSGLLKTARLENPKLIGQLIEVEPGEDFQAIIEKLKENSHSPSDNQIRYQDGKRYVSGLSEVEVSQEAEQIPWKNQGVYLITGGAGGLGLIFTKEIAQKVKDATLILTGRSQLHKDKQAQLKELEALGTRVEYKQIDVTKKDDVAGLIQGIWHDYGSLNGIIHGAGVIRDNYIIKKTKDDFTEVLAPKVSGLVNLDEASKDLPLDFFILFSSIAGSLGSLGQADYAAANAFMDAYARYRNGLVAAQERKGQTLSINWPLWQEGGMHVDEETEKMMVQKTGMVAMRTKTGLQVLYQALAGGSEQVMVVEGDVPRIKQKLLLEKSTVSEPQKFPETSDSTMEIDTAKLSVKVQAFLKQEVSKLLKINLGDINVDSSFNDYGFESTTFTQLASKLNREFCLEIMPTIFYEYSTIRDLTDFLTKEHRANFESKFATKIKRGTPAQPIIDERKAVSPNRKRRSRFAITSLLQAPAVSLPTGPEPVAVVGMSGIFPMAKDLNKFWANLRDGKDCITEVPEGRWNWEDYKGDLADEVSKESIKWGGFIEGVDQFDPLFFGISPKEAEVMDPQQRLLMTYVWRAIEDAGYSGRSLSGTNTAIFVGTGNSDYGGLIFRSRVSIGGHSLRTLPSMGPNRISYFLNIHGPSEPIETACSSSLVAIHRAIDALRNRNCEMAFAGGVNTILTPDSQITSSIAGVLSEDGRCKSFSNGANGYVRGEGVGMLLLKRLKDAERDGDHIYGIIRSSSVNHGGRGNSLTAPNPRAQADLLIDAYTKAGIDPRTVTYIEAHATGTELGDSLEINGLLTAFKELYEMTGDSRVLNAHCGLGTVKSNIGHLEMAGGVAGVIKVLLQLKKKTLVKSLHCDTINPYIKLEGSPFYILQESREWEVLKDSEGKEIPRRAGISSFGIGGVNAHIVIEEYVAEPESYPPLEVSSEKPAVIVLSAKDEQRLKEQAQQLLATIHEENYSDSSLTDIAYTLQMGRQSMEERLALIVDSMGQLEEKLKEFLEGRELISDLYRGHVKRHQETLAVFADEDLQKAMEVWITKGKYAKLADLWVKGLSLDWDRFYGDRMPRRISLPTYPFAKERYWVPENNGRLDGGDSQDGELGESITNPDQISRDKPYTEGGFTEPAKPVEKILADIWGKVLGVSNIGMNDNFFNLGGDSIFGLRVMASAKEQGLELFIQQLFEYPTISELAMQLKLPEAKGKTKKKKQVFELLSEEDKAIISQL